MANIGCKYKHQAKALKAHCQNLEMFVEKLIKEKGPTLEDAFAASELLMLGEILRGPAKPCSHQIICARQDVIEQALESYQNLKASTPKKGNQQQG